MKKEKFQARMAQGPLILGSAFGTNLQAVGMPHGISTEAWVLEHPNALIQVQRAFLDAGTQMLHTPTFRLNPAGMALYDISGSLPELVKRLSGVTLEAAAGRALVAGSVGGVGRRFGADEYARLYDGYAQQITELCKTGVDVIWTETLIAEEEALVILDAANAACDLPVLVSFTVESDGSLMLGGNVFDAAADLEALGAAAVGINCSVGPDQLESVVAGIRSRVQVPVIAKPNAGIPTITDKGEAVYAMSATRFARFMRPLRDAGATLLGGCCGTTPDYIRAMCEML